MAHLAMEVLFLLLGERVRLSDIMYHILGGIVLLH